MDLCQTRPTMVRHIYLDSVYFCKEGMIHPTLWGEQQEAQEPPQPLTFRLDGPGLFQKFKVPIALRKVDPRMRARKDLRIGKRGSPRGG